jgi:hypothetical protein
MRIGGRDIGVYHANRSATNLQITSLNVREVSGSFLVLRLLFREEPSQGNDICVDCFSDSAAILSAAIAVGSHDEA